MTIKLRPRQIAAIEKARQAVRDGKQNIMLVGPPGLGKASMIAAMAASAVQKGGMVVGWVHKRDLVFEIADRMKNQFGIEAGIILAGQPVHKDRKVQIISVLSGIRRDLSWMKPTFLFSDEAHRRLTNSQDAIHEKFPGVPLVSFTATAFRSSKKRKFAEVYDEFIQISTYRQEMADRFLVPTRVIAPKGIASMDGVKLKMSNGEMDYDTEEMAERFAQERLYASMLSEWTKYTGRRQPTIVFNVNKRHNIEVCEFFRKHGVRAEYVDEKTPDSVRDEILRKFKQGPFVKDPIMVLCNIGVFTEGVSAEYTRCIILNYRTKSKSKYVQSSARGSRPVWNSDYSDWLKVDGKYYKEHITIIDCGANWAVHGLLEDYDQFPAEMDDEREPGEPPVKSCPECDTVLYASIMTCTCCGHIFPPKPKTDEKPLGDEVEWGEVNKDQAIVKTVINMKAKMAERVPTEQLRIVALIKGYDKRWIWQRVSERGEYQQEGVFQWQGRGSFEEYLENIEKERGTYTIYERLKSKRIAI